MRPIVLTELISSQLRALH